MTTTYQKYSRLEDIPDTLGKQVLLKILNSPKVDRERLRRDVRRYEKKRLEEWAEEDKNLGANG
ncbi:MAG: hypothetical protein IKQ66_06265 [Treponema sp.]|nr:hypothetical protein [Treponema sp.]MBR6193741.1 hypothetical protein [Treponema sp.]